MATRLLLIMCEGKTEKEYFEILRRAFRLPAYIDSMIFGEKGQHKPLIDKTVQKRSEVAEEFGLDEIEIEAWAVCDDDRMACSYQELLHYAEDRSVKLAFSKPQFEYFLLQHFEPCRDSKKQEIFAKLGHYRGQYGEDPVYDNSVKAHLDWVQQAIEDKPILVRTAIANSDLRDSPQEKTFLTVQRLPERFLELEVR